MSSNGIRHEIGRVDMSQVLDSILGCNRAKTDSMNTLCKVRSDFSNDIIRIRKDGFYSIQWEPFGQRFSHMVVHICEFRV